MPLSITLPYPPSVNHYLARGGSKPYLTADAQAYKELVGYALLSLGIEPLTGPVAVTITSYRPRKKGDIDGVLKLALDSMNGYVYGDDSQVITLHVYRLDDKDNPRLEVTIEEVK